MKEFWSKHHENIITFLLCAVLFVGVLSIIALFGGVIMRIFGFQYKSVGSIILFFIIAIFPRKDIDYEKEIINCIYCFYDVTNMCMWKADGIKWREE